MVGKGLHTLKVPFVSAGRNLPSLADYEGCTVGAAAHPRCPIYVSTFLGAAALGSQQHVLGDQFMTR